MQAKDGAVQGPFVTKHWRQDWRYEDTRAAHVSRPEHVGDRAAVARAGEGARGRRPSSRWTTRRATRRTGAGSTSATCRAGRARRPGGRSRGASSRCARTTTSSSARTGTRSRRPAGSQQEDNLKVVLDERSRPAASQPVVSEELGLNRYERLERFDDSAARRYRERTEPFWEEVRAAWARHRRAPPRGSRCARRPTRDSSSRRCSSMPSGSTMVSRTIATRRGRSCERRCRGTSRTGARRRGRATEGTPSRAPPRRRRAR